jgi:hypothetical protein
LFVGSIAAFFLPVVWGSVLLPTASDLTEVYYPAFIFLSEALHTGQSFLWTPHLFSGFPWYASQVAGFFDPVNIVLNLALTPPWSVELRLMLDMFVTMLCAYAAARAVGVSRLWASFVGPSYLLAFDWLYLSNPLTANSLFVLPLLIYCLAKLSESDTIRWRFVALGGVGYGWAVLCGYTQVVLYAALLGGVYLAAYVWLARLPWRRALRLVGAYVAVGCIGLVLGLPQLVPAAKFLPNTPRAQTASYESATLKVIAPGDLLTALVPPSFYVPYVTAGRKPMYIGALMMLAGVGALCWLGAAVYRRRRELEPAQQRMAAVGAAFLFAFIAALKYSPLYWLISKSPILSAFRFPFRFMFLGAFLLALLGAYGLEHAAQLRASRLWRVVVYGVGTLAGLFIAGAAFVNMLSQTAVGRLAELLSALFSKTLQGHLGFTKDAASYAHAFEQGIYAYREFLSFAVPGVLLPMLALAAGVSLALLFVRGKISVGVFHRGAVGVLLFGIVATGVAGWRVFAPMAEFRGTNVFAPYMKDLEQYRTYSFLIGEAATTHIPPQYKLSSQESAAVRELYSVGQFPNENIYHGVPTVDGYDQFEPQMTLEKMLLLGSELGGGGATSGTPKERQDTLLKHLDTLGLMGGKYIVSGVPLPHPSLALVATSSVTSYGMTLYVYRNSKALPIYFLAQAQCVACAPRSGTLAPTRVANGLYQFKVFAPAPRTLVISQTNVPGWTATLDGEPVSVRLINDLYLGVDIPTGTHVVSFEYQGIVGELTALKLLRLVR